MQGHAPSLSNEKAAYQNVIDFQVIIAMTVVGNTLVVVAVFSYRPLKKVQNYFLVSLAASDLAVAVFVMPLHVVKFLADLSIVRKKKKLSVSSSSSRAVKSGGA
ncbi:unnamed protein product [Heligmosomoides polygyrus]|uniref:G_PROTEIN_RECEP_F1_2 domain-containing protein n=1 Tax=Heligmosomoides polygyrus TaxID=6339 RepID=A0A183FRY7_HELPZ|nr:unnamed protein product [Heligmosomoides polygyrus]